MSYSVQCDQPILRGRRTLGLFAMSDLVTERRSEREAEAEAERELVVAYYNHTMSTLTSRSALRLTLLFI